MHNGACQKHGYHRLDLCWWNTLMCFSIMVWISAAGGIKEVLSYDYLVEDERTWHKEAQSAMKLIVPLNVWMKCSLPLCLLLLPSPFSLSPTAFVSMIFFTNSLGCLYFDSGFVQKQQKVSFSERRLWFFTFSFKNKSCQVRFEANSRLNQPDFNS